MSSYSLKINLVGFPTFAQNKRTTVSFVNTLHSPLYNRGRGVIKSAKTRDLWKFKWGSSVFWRKREHSQKCDSVYVMFTVHTSNSRYYIHDLFHVMESVPKNLRAAWLWCRNFSWYLSRVTSLTKDQGKERLSPLLWWTVAERKNKRWCLCNWKISVTHNR